GGVGPPGHGAGIGVMLLSQSTWKLQKRAPDAESSAEKKPSHAPTYARHWTTGGEALTASVVGKSHAGSMSATFPALMSESAFVKLCFRSRPYIGQSRAAAADARRSQPTANMITTRRLDGSMSAPPWQKGAELEGSPAPRVNHKKNVKR